MRIFMSVGPPAGNGTMILMARLGKAWARSACATTATTPNFTVSPTARATVRPADQTFIVPPAARLQSFWLRVGSRLQRKYVEDSRVTLVTQLRRVFQLDFG